MILMNTVALDRDVAVRRTATAEPRPADHALRWLCCPSPNSISGPSIWVITLSSFGDLTTIGEITVACALGYLDFRFANEPWRPGHPKLDAWYARVVKLPAMAGTMPPAG